VNYTNSHYLPTLPSPPLPPIPSSPSSPPSSPPSTLLLLCSLHQIGAVTFVAYEFTSDWLEYILLQPNPDFHFYFPSHLLHDSFFFIFGLSKAVKINISWKQLS
ncbi:hypothetical protein ES288_D10G277700v1, partial [Gossypium darwinii]